MSNIQIIDADFIRTRPLPQPAEGSKEERGRVCIIGGSREVPGAVLLAALGAMRAGGGKLQVATVESRAGALALAMPEAMVISLPETHAGGLQCRTIAAIGRRFASADAILVGPGMVEEPDCDDILAHLVNGDGEAVIVVDAGALPKILDRADGLRRRPGRVIITPHAGEMANLLGVSKSVVEADPTATARRLSDELGLVVVMKGSRTIVTSPSGIWPLSRRRCRAGDLRLGRRARRYYHRFSRAWRRSCHGSHLGRLPARRGRLAAHA